MAGSSRCIRTKRDGEWHKRWEHRQVQPSHLGVHNRRFVRWFKRFLFSLLVCLFIGGDICLGQVVSGVFGCVLAVLYFLSFFLFPPTIRLLGSYIRLFDIARHRKCLFSVETNAGRRTGGSTVFILITSACDCSSLLL